MIANQLRVFRRGHLLAEGLCTAQKLQMVSSAAGQNNDYLLVIYLVPDSLPSENENQDCLDHSIVFYSYPNLGHLDRSKAQGGKRQRQMQLQLSLLQVQRSLAWRVWFVLQSELHSCSSPFQVPLLRHLGDFKVDNREKLQRFIFLEVKCYTWSWSQLEEE